MVGFAAKLVREAVRAGQGASYETAVITLAARLARCDGPVVRAEIDAFKAAFSIPPEALREVGRRFDAARDGTIDPLFFARALRTAFPGPQGRTVLAQVFAALQAVARADGPVNAEEAAFLAIVREGLGLAEARAMAAPDNPYAVLGLSASAPDTEVRARWRALVRENHPDVVAGRGLPPEAARRAGQLAARVNAAWDQIKRERNL